MAEFYGLLNIFVAHFTFTQYNKAWANHAFIKRCYLFLIKLIPIGECLNKIKYWVIAYIFNLPLDKAHACNGKVTCLLHINSAI